MDTPRNSSVPWTMEYKHAPLNHKKSSIRLVQLLPILSADGLVQCKISQHVLPTAESEHSTGSITESREGLEDHDENAPLYMCLSYVWGDPGVLATIIVDGKRFSIRQNLFDFLAIARLTLSYTWLWIDALCIDQSNTLERNHQVLQMGRIYTGAAKVLVWLGKDVGAERVLREINLASMRSNYPAYEAATQYALLWKSRPLIDFDLPLLRLYELRKLATGTGGTFDLLNDTTGGKVEKLFEDLVDNEYWSRAWVTQEVLLARYTVVLAGTEAHGLTSLARIFRAAIHNFKENAFESLIDMVLQKRNQRRGQEGGNTGLEGWGIINLLDRFRHKKCAIRRDRIYSLLALSKEAETLNVDYDVPEKEIMHHVLATCGSSVCLCSAGIVAHALAPWEHEPNKASTYTPFAELHMFASALSSATCPFCFNWVPFSWTRREGLVFCLGTACPDTPGHLFWEQHSSDNNTSEKLRSCNTSKQNLKSIHLQLRQNNKSQLLCKQGAGINIIQSEWKHMYLLQFTFEKLVETLLNDSGPGDLGLNACENLWSNESNRRISGEGRLRLCTTT